MKIIESKTRINQTLDGQRVAYFDATSHPLGDPSLKVVI
jgi:hypothetical protein